jgi:hypothetical protein
VLYQALLDAGLADQGCKMPSFDSMDVFLKDAVAGKRVGNNSPLKVKTS